jgi:iron complex outermembrane recepter protein
MPSTRLRRPRPVALAAAACLAMAHMAASAQAQAPAPADAPPSERQTTAEPERITVTGTRRNETASKTPINITAIGEQALREENITDAKRLIQRSVAISAPENPARFADSVTVRGLNVSPVNANNIEQFTRSTLAYYLDDTPLPNLGYRIKDIARVETLLGPQGTLYGAGSLGGTVRYITNRPRLGKVEARLDTSFWQVQHGGLSNDTDVVVNLPIGDSVALRASVARLDEKGYVDRVSNPPWRTGGDAWSSKPDTKTNVYEDDDWQRVTGGRFSALWRIKPGLDVLVAHTTQNQLANGTSGISRLPLAVANARTTAERDLAWKNPQRSAADQPCFPNCKYASELETPYAVNDHTILSRYPEYADRKFRMNSIDIDWDLGFAALHSSTSQFKDSRIGQADYASQGWSFYAPESPILDGYDLGGTITTDRSAYITFDNTYKGLSHETRLTSKGVGAWDWIAGLYHTTQKRNQRFSEVLPGMDAYINGPGGVGKATPSPLPDVGYSEDLGSKYTESALFGEVGYRITPQWRVNLGARVFNYEDTANVDIVDYAGGAVSNQYTATGKASGKRYYKLNSSYQFTDNLLGYATFSQGFRRGGTNPFRDRGATRIVAPDVRDYKPDSTDNIELGLKGYTLDGALYVEAAAYQIHWKDTQTYRSQDVSGFPVNGTANGPDSLSRGFELTARYKLTQAWQLNYAGATTRAKWDGTKTQCLYVAGTSCRTWAEGGNLGGAPKWKHDFGVRFQHSFDNDLYLWASVNARYSSKVQADRSDSVADNANATYYPADTRYSASIGLSRGAWEAQLWGRNLANSNALVSSQAAGLMGPRDITTQPRSFGLNLSYRFF